LPPLPTTRVFCPPFSTHHSHLPPTYLRRPPFGFSVHHAPHLCCPPFSLVPTTCLRCYHSPLPPIITSGTHHSTPAPTTQLCHPPVTSAAHHSHLPPQCLRLLSPTTTHLGRPLFCFSVHHLPLPTTIRLQHPPCTFRPPPFASTTHHSDLASTI